MTQDPAPVIKHVHEDFLVREALVLELAEGASAPFQYLTVRKRGLTTTEAVELLAAACRVDSSQVTYAGRKDEDGVTEQFLAVPAGSFEAAAEFRHSSGDRWMTARHYGYGRTALRIGGLPGNSFRIVVRNLPGGHAESLAGHRRMNAFTLNYYDTQRFGVPTGPKRTHLVGRALLKGDWETALGEVVRLNAPESRGAASWTGDPADYFRAEDPRKSSFYLAAHASHQWNSALMEEVSAHCRESQYPTYVDGLEYRWLHAAEDATRLLSARSSLPYNRYELTPTGITRGVSERPTVLQTVIDVLDSASDEAHPGRFRATLSFFLTSGGYATSVVRQVLGYRPWSEQGTARS
ncbi:tRNA pseudouridine(13) synthase TruD [Streptomyces sp. NPDC020192]|uniref:tRNA pseudouridine(13) synthase TruD n=1 Tax=Streptomyces sp. NPDC020192 TaxID=3365066 RepID=UPI0037A22CAA